MTESLNWEQEACKVFDNLKFLYKELQLLKRLCICLVLALLPGLYIYFDSIGELDEQYTTAEGAAQGAASKLVAAQGELKNLPALVAELDLTREQLKIAEVRLPNNVQIDEILRNVGKAVKPAAAKVLLFEPQKEIVRGSVYKYVEVPIKVSIEAREYSQICEWIDSLAGEKKAMFLNSWSVTRSKVASTPQSGDKLQAPAGSPQMAEAQMAALSRENFRLTFEGNFSLFKQMSLADVEMSSMPDKRPSAADAPPTVATPAVDGEGAPAEAIKAPPPVAVPPELQPMKRTSNSEPTAKTRGLL